MNPAIQISQLSKRYKKFSAVEDVSLEIGKGEIYGFIGLNGSGKTTTIKMLLGMAGTETALEAGSFFLVFFTGFIGLAATVSWWL